MEGELTFAELLRARLAIASPRRDDLLALGRELHFHPAVGLDAERARSLTPIVQRRILRLYVRRGLLTESTAADMLTGRGTGGFSLDGSVRIAAHAQAVIPLIGASPETMGPGAPEQMPRGPGEPPPAVHPPSRASS